jgi:diguanylate cyclase (GGDEF)-like protein
VREAGGLRLLVYQSSRTRVTRVPGFVHKEPLGPDAARRVRHERAMLQRLQGIDGVPSLAFTAADGTALVMQDCGPVTLASLIRDAPLPQADLLALARDLTKIVAAAHRRGVVHKDISPANVLVEQDRPWLIDFETATTAAEERPGFTHASLITGTLAYLAPEQTGRTGRSVDRRTDLYSLGATLYQVATGRTPFPEADAFHLIHDQLATVPEPPIALNPDLPPAFSAIVMRLLEKEPDRRYQSADGLLHDLTLLADLPQALGSSLFLGERDFPVRLAPPSRPVGRDAEIERLRVAFTEARRGKARSVLVSGAPGVGKTALIDELRPVVAASGGWFVSGKFDQYRQDLQVDAVAQAMRGLGRLLLAEPEAELATIRADITREVGPNAGLVAAILPEFGVLLGATPEAQIGDDDETRARLFSGAMSILRNVVSPSRPLVFSVDDLQWAAGTPITFLDVVLTDPELSGILVVGSYREADVDETHPLTAMLARWQRLGVAPVTVRLGNLPTADLTAMLSDMLRMRPKPAAELAADVGARTGGNPFDTIEFVNTLRRDGVLSVGDAGWQWDKTALRTYIGETDVVEQLAGRIHRLPPRTRLALKVMACLGGETELELLGAALAVDVDRLEDWLGPALEDGLLVAEQGGTGRAVRFRHDRVSQAASTLLPPEVLRRLRLALARRLVRHDAYGPVAAQQYLPVADDLREPGECRAVAILFRGTATGLRLVNVVAGEQFLAAALRVLGGVEGVDDLRAGLEVDRHRALYRLGRLLEADALYRSIERRCDPLELAEPAAVQMESLTIRQQLQEAVTLGLAVLERLGFAVPPPEEFAAEVEAGLDRLSRWAAAQNPAVSAATDAARPEIEDPRLLAAGRLILQLTPVAFFSEHKILAWLVGLAQRLWEDHGPSRLLIGALAHVGGVPISRRGDYHTGYYAHQHLMAVGELRGWAAETGLVRFLASVSTEHWFQPIEEGMRLAHRAREGLLRAGEQYFAAATYFATTRALLDCAPTLDEYLAEVDEALAFAARTGNEQQAETLNPLAALGRELTGLDTSFYDADAYTSGRIGNPLALLHFHLKHAMIALIFGDTAALVRHAEISGRWRVASAATYSIANVRLFDALAKAAQVRQGGPESLLAELDDARKWLAERAADAPANFRHLVGFIDAERAWATGDLDGAADAFDTALGEPAVRLRPWHHALLVERYAYLRAEQGHPYASGVLLGEAHRLYREWGAITKVKKLERENPRLRRTTTALNSSRTSHTDTISSGSIDLFGVVKVAQALSAETNLERLRLRVAEVLGALTGATSVELVLWSDDTNGWYVPPDPTGTVDEAGAKGLLPLSVFRYVERTREPLLVEDALRDDRFARDRYLAGLDHCSLLAVPVMTQGSLRAVLILENRLSSGTFTTDRLDAVVLIAGQLAVSFDNAMLYASLERKVAERTEELREANQRLEAMSVTDSLTGLANRRQLDDRLEAEWQRGVRTGDPLSIAMIDVDYFKPYNDHYGHLAGDSCLQRVAEALQAKVRSVDVIARYGGEEFAIVLPGADLPIAHQVAERVRLAVLGLNEKHAASVNGVVTVSIGVASARPTTAGSVRELIRVADTELYEAKAQGRNKVMCSETPW